MDKADSGVSDLSLSFVEALYGEYLRDPSRVSAEWARYFRQVDANGGFPAQALEGPRFPKRGLFGSVSPEGRSTPQAETPSRGIPDAIARQDRVDQLIRAYRVRGHMIAKLDPLGMPRPEQPELDPGFYGLGEADLDRRFSARTIHGAEVMTLRQILDRLRRVYCRSIGVQFMHIDDATKKSWIQDRLEGEGGRLPLTRQQQLRIFTKLTDAVIFEEFVQKKFLGAKSFSLEGAESLIPLLSFAIGRAAQHGVDEIVVGMPHRGRLPNS